MAYNNSIIYKLHCNITGDDYYGSTTNYKSRICSHKCKTEKELSKRNCVSKQIILRGDYTFSIVEEYNCDTRKKLLERERYYIENNKCINMVVPYKSREEILASKRQYWKDNNIKLTEQKAVYRKTNREKLNKQQNERYHNNKEKIRAKYSEALVCDCGVSHTRNHKSRHLKSKFHLNFIKKLSI